MRAVVTTNFCRGNFRNRQSPGRAGLSGGQVRGDGRATGQTRPPTGRREKPQLRGGADALAEADEARLGGAAKGFLKLYGNYC